MMAPEMNFGLMLIPIVFWIGVKIFAPIFFSQEAANKMFDWAGFLVISAMWVIFYCLVKNLRFAVHLFAVETTGVCIYLLMLIYFAYLIKLKHNKKT